MRADPRDELVAKLAELGERRRKGHADLGCAQVEHACARSALERPSDPGRPWAIQRVSSGSDGRM
jgi:hypothetical protein